MKKLNLICGALVLAQPAVAQLVVYEPFDDAEVALSGNTAGLGLIGPWAAGGGFEVVSESFSFGSLPTFGNRVVKTSGNFQGASLDASSLGDAGLLDDDAVLWFSCLIMAQTVDGGTSRSYLTIGTGGPDGFDRVGGPSGFGAGLKVNSGEVTAHGWSGGAKRGNVATVADGLIFAVGKMTWAPDGSDDVIEIFLPESDLVLPGAPVSTLEFDFDQSGFTILGFAGGNSGMVPAIDEIRFGGSYEDVIGGDPVPEVDLVLGITKNAPDSRFLMSWPTRDGRFYNVRSSPDLTGAISTWDLVEGNIEPSGTGTNTLEIDPAAETLFYSVEEIPAP